jgi:hypothetical protein
VDPPQHDAQRWVIALLSGPTNIKLMASVIRARAVIALCAVQKAFACAIQGDGMMRSLAYVDTDEDFVHVWRLGNLGHRAGSLAAKVDTRLR